MTFSRDSQKNSRCKKCNCLLRSGNVSIHCAPCQRKEPEDEMAVLRRHWKMMGELYVERNRLADTSPSEPEEDHGD